MNTFEVKKNSVNKEEVCNLVLDDCFVRDGSSGSGTTYYRFLGYREFRDMNDKHIKTYESIRYYMHPNNQWETTLIHLPDQNEIVTRIPCKSIFG